MQYGADLYAGGEFLSAGGLAVNHIARWDGQAWHAVAGGMSDGPWPAVTSLAVHDGRLVAGGWFERAGGVAAQRIAAWDGATWAALGDGLDNLVWSVVSFGDLLIAGGDFLQAGGAPAARIAAWDGLSWQPLGAGAGEQVRCLHTAGTSFYAGGPFQQVGGMPSFHIARWDEAGGSAVGEGPLAGGGLRLRRVGPALTGDAVALTFDLTRARPVRLTVHDAEGRQVALLATGPFSAGTHQAVWSQRAARGLYFARLLAGDQTVTCRLMRF